MHQQEVTVVTDGGQASMHLAGSDSVCTAVLCIYTHVHTRTCMHTRVCPPTHMCTHTQHICVHTHTSTQSRGRDLCIHSATELLTKPTAPSPPSAGPQGGRAEIQLELGPRAVCGFSQKELHVPKEVSGGRTDGEPRIKLNSCKWFTA